jgi:uncharacterized repeat protein (TIGR03803 family)
LGEKMIKKIRISWSFWLAMAVLMTAVVAPQGAANSASLRTIYSFCSKSGCPVGVNPFGDLIMDSTGTLYGTTLDTVFALVPNKTKTTWTETLLYRFCSKTGCTDGGDALSGLLMDASGDLYGTTNEGGAQGLGVVYRLTPNSAKTRWTETVLYSFCPRGQPHCTDGAWPQSGLIMDKSGDLYGTTTAGGIYPSGSPLQFGGGTVFELIPNAGRTKWTEKVLHSFCSQSGANCVDGAVPPGGVIIDSSGSLYGTTREGGANATVPGRAGTVFELIPNAAKTTWTQKVLHSFCQKLPCLDGMAPFGGLIMDSSGDLYGTAGVGGTLGGGIVFKFSPNSSKTAWTETVLHDFCAVGRLNCTDGYAPRGVLIIDPAGRLYGISGYKVGTNGSAGAVFEVSPNVAKTVWTETVLHHFCSLSNCADGEQPEGGLVRDSSGKLYGTTVYGGFGSGGTVFELTP